MDECPRMNFCREYTARENLGSTTPSKCQEVEELIGVPVARGVISLMCAHSSAADKSGN
jgi:hypothetical protein